MAEKDNIPLQSERIVNAVKDLNPDCIVIFDKDAGFNKIRFRIEIESSGLVLTSAFPHFHVSEIADMSDERLKQTIKALTAERI